MKIYIVSDLDLVPWRALNWEDAFYIIRVMRRWKKLAPRPEKNTEGRAEKCH